MPPALPAWSPQRVSARPPDGGGRAFPSADVTPQIARPAGPAWSYMATGPAGPQGQRPRPAADRPACPLPGPAVPCVAARLLALRIYAVAGKVAAAEGRPQPPPHPCGGGSLLPAGLRARDPPGYRAGRQTTPPSPVCRAAARRLAVGSRWPLVPLAGVRPPVVWPAGSGPWPLNASPSSQRRPQNAGHPPAAGCSFASLAAARRWRPRRVPRAASGLRAAGSTAPGFPRLLGQQP